LDGPPVVKFADKEIEVKVRESGKLIETIMGIKNK
jgi:hypothetical protein